MLRTLQHCKSPPILLIVSIFIEQISGASPFLNQQKCGFKCKSDSKCLDESNKICDGIVDCKDGSDENLSICSHLTQIRKRRNVIGSCLTPNFPKNGNWTLVGQESLAKPDETVPEASIIQYNCKKGYLPNGKSSLFSICVNQTWIVSEVKCSPICGELKSSATTLVKCYLNGQQIPCSEAVDNTIAKFTCAPFHEDTSTNSNVRFCVDGSWDQPSPHCAVICGLKIKELKPFPFIVSGVYADTVHPWNVGIYKKINGTAEYYCGGTLIDQRMILTAAHCITELGSGKLQDSKNFVVGVGKIYRNYNDSRDITAQYLDTEEFLVPSQYKGQNFLADLGIIVTTKPVQISSSVLPVCLDKDNTFSLNTSLPGTTVGWSTNSADAKIGDSRVNYLNDKECGVNISEEFLNRYYTNDKLCAGFLKKGGEGGCDLTGRQSGAGLVFRNHKDDDRFYLKGIASVAPRSDDTNCEVDYVLYTKVNEYISFIVSNILKYEKLG